MRPASHLGHESEDDKELAYVANSKGTMAASRRHAELSRSSSEQSSGGTYAAAAGGRRDQSQRRDSGAEGERFKLQKDKPRKKKAQKKRGAAPTEQDGLEC